MCNAHAFGYSQYQQNPSGDAYKICQDEFKVSDWRTEPRAAACVSGFYAEPNFGVRCDWPNSDKSKQFECPIQNGATQRNR
jgi:hypothetical protein